LARRGPRCPSGAKNKERSRDINLADLERKLRSSKATHQNLSDEEDVSKDPKALCFVVMSPTKQNRTGRLVDVKLSDADDFGDNNNNVSPSCHDGSQDKSSCSEGEDEVREEEKQMRTKCLHVANTVSITLHDLLKLLPRSGHPSSVHGMVDHNYHLPSGKISLICLFKKGSYQCG
jgi:hypothetical protein